MSLIDLVQQHLGPQEIQQISQQLGVDQNTAQTAVQAAVPMMVGGMASTASQPAGASTLQSLLGSHSNVLENLGGILGSGGSANAAGGLLGSLGGMIGAPADSGGGLLGKILGHHETTVQQGVQQASGLGADQTKRLLMILGPIVLAALARRHAQATAQGGTDTTLTNVLQQDAQAAQAQAPSPHVGGLLGKILSHVEAPRP
jgi:hypothetical protein